jgi:FKBP-type peptidyl-prolyl cis-trans isomerase
MRFSLSVLLLSVLSPIIVSSSSCIPIEKEGHDAPEVKYIRLVCNYCEGQETKAKDTLWVNYNGTLTTEDGPLFDSSYSGKGGLGDPLNFTLGSGDVIKGFDAGLWGMCAGDVRLITIPPEYGYGSKGVEGAIPPNSTLGKGVSALCVQGHSAHCI